MAIEFRLSCILRRQDVLSFEPGIIFHDKLLHPTDYVGCNYLSLSVIPASDTTLHIIRIL